MTTCPTCAEPVHAAALRCPHCRSRLKQTAHARDFVLVGVAVAVVLAGLGLYGIASYRQAQARAAFRQQVGQPPPSPAEAAQHRRLMIYRAVQFDGEAAAAKRYAVTLDEVRAIVAEGQREGWK